MNSSSSVQSDRPAVTVALLLARVVTGIVFLPHGIQLLFGGLGGPGVVAFARLLGPVAYLVAIAQFFGAFALIVGLLSRFSAASLIVVMVGAVAIMHRSNGFFMNWAGNQKGEGFEYHIIMIGLLLVTLVAGPGRFSLARRLRASNAVE